VPEGPLARRGQRIVDLPGGTGVGRGLRDATERGYGDVVAGA
jgi:hypothetical protein